VTGSEGRRPVRELPHLLPPRKLPLSRGGHSVMSDQFMNREEAKWQGYQETPSGLQWSPARPQPVDKSHWKPCSACGRLIPVEGREGVSNPIESSEGVGNWTYVCPFCGHCQAGTHRDSQDLRAQTACHKCGTQLGTAFQCPSCLFPRGWMIVKCPYCGKRQPVNAPHWVVHCDMFTLECVKCECCFYSLCIC
jgi:hypothetical protein